MSYFIFVGDMLVMLFMIILVVWVFVKSSDETVETSANIPLEDDLLGVDLTGEQHHG